mmetsp:Transcript_14494/g.42263  ORF Transcript_14494/g.42263 Transcript_14494/m.42263 type:complete len:200 (+) Transcript_14494:25-624(+)
MLWVGAWLRGWQRCGLQVDVMIVTESASCASRSIINVMAFTGAFRRQPGLLQQRAGALFLANRQNQENAKIVDDVSWLLGRRCRCPRAPLPNLRQSFPGHKRAGDTHDPADRQVAVWHASGEDPHGDLQPAALPPLQRATSADLMDTCAGSSHAPAMPGDLRAGAHTSIPNIFDPRTLAAPRSPASRRLQPFCSRNGEP